MKAKKYRLETVLTIRRRAKDEAARQVALRLEELARAEAELARRRKDLQQCYQRQTEAQNLMQTELNRGIQARGILAHQTFLNDLRQLETELKEAVDKQIGVVRRCETELETARGKLTESARELKSIETHKENWRIDERTQENRRAQKISDEIGAILHGRRDRS